MQFEGFFFSMVYIFIYFQFLAVLGLCKLLRMDFSSCDEQGATRPSCYLKVFLILAKGKSCMRGNY